jgi:hypothetical protein
MRTALAVFVATLVTAASALAQDVDADSDAPESPAVVTSELIEAASYQEALRRWHRAEDINAWIGARFRYDTARAVQLSETQRQKNGRMPIIAPEAFFAAPSGVCVDLARFGVETLRAIDPALRPRYLMIEFDPVSISGNMLRRHWLVAFERDGRHYFFADSKRPGRVAGPYASTVEFIAEYARYRGRPIVAFGERDSYERELRTLAVRQPAS